MGKNIVILTMGLDIGGAETHIVELAGELRRQGHTVTIFSSGGAFTEQLDALDVKHITAPMNNKHLISLIRSYRALLHFCKNGPKVSVIHSHTRITNFIANLVCKKLDIPLVTTVHFNFKLNFWTKMFSRWGIRSLAVSEDLKTYVADGYGIDRDKVRITVNGINLNTFSKQDNLTLRAQYGLNEENKVILCVSRIDTGACENVFRFLESAKEIYDAVPQARIVIVGNGNRFEELKKLTQGINAKTCENYIQLAGAKTNIADYLHMADAFAGVSRSALEAMACRLPTIIIGNQGYLGVYSEKILPACIETNFTCRGYDYVSAHEVAEIMISMLSTPEKFSENIEAAHKLIEQRYSVTAMAQDALTSYQEAQNDMRPNDLMVSGYYGTHNFGDDITLKAIISNISNRFPVQKIAVLNHYATSDSSDSRISYLHRFNLLQILPLMKKTKLFVLGGGSLLQDVTSNRSIFYYFFMLRHAQKYGCKTMIYANGIGPIIKKEHKKQLKQILKKVDCITIRDSISHQFLLELGIDESKIKLTADEAYNYDISASFELPDIALPEDRKIFLVNLRTYNSFSKDISTDIAAAINQAASEHSLYPVLMPVQFSQDQPLLQKVSEKLSVEHHLFDKALTEQQIIALIERCDYILTERLHPIIFAARMQKPFISIVYDPKVIATAQKFGMQDYALDLTEIEAPLLCDKISKLIIHQNEIAASLKPIAEQQHQIAKENSQIAGQLLRE